MSLPEGLKFLQFGWWVVHLLAILWLYSYAYRKGRRDEQKAQRLRAGTARESAPAARAD